MPVYPVHGDGVELLEGQVPGRFGAVPPLGLHEAEQSVPGLVLGDLGNPGRTDAGCGLHFFESSGSFYWVRASPDVGHQGVPVDLRLGVVGGGRGVQVALCRHAHS